MDQTGATNSGGSSGALTAVFTAVGYIIVAAGGWIASRRKRGAERDKVVVETADMVVDMARQEVARWKGQLSDMARQLADCETKHRTTMMELAGVRARLALLEQASPPVT